MILQTILNSIQGIEFDQYKNDEGNIIIDDDLLLIYQDDIFEIELDIYVECITCPEEKYRHRYVNLRRVIISNFETGDEMKFDPRYDNSIINTTICKLISNL